MIRVYQGLVFFCNVHVRLQDRSDKLYRTMNIRLNFPKLLLVGSSFFTLNPAPTDDETLEYFASVEGNSGPDVDNHGIDSVD